MPFYSPFSSKSTTAPRVDLVAQLLRHALDPSASAGEAANAADKLVTVARREGVNIEDLRHFMATAGDDRAADAVPAACAIVMPFGKYAGRTLGNIAIDDLPYLEWLLEEATTLRPALRAAIGDVRKFYCGGGA